MLYLLFARRPKGFIVLQVEVAQAKVAVKERSEKDAIWGRI
jgi:hypothetical protein